MSSRTTTGGNALHVLLGRISRPDDDAILDLLLVHEADTHLVDNGGNTPLHEACRYDKAVVPLLAAACDPNATNANGSTPMHVAAVNASRRSLAALLKYPVDPFIRNRKGKLAIDCTNRADITAIIQSEIKRRIKTFLLVLVRQTDPIYSLIDMDMIDDVLGPNGFLFRHIVPGTLW